MTLLKKKGYRYFWATLGVKIGLLIISTSGHTVVCSSGSSDPNGASMTENKIMND